MKTPCARARRRPHPHPHPHPQPVPAVGRYRRRGLAAAVLAAVSCLALGRPLPADSVTDAEEAMQAREFGRAAELLASESGSDYPLYLRALALFHEGKFAESAGAAEELAGRHPGSEWRHKARFLQARAFIELRRHREAEAIFAAEADRIFSEDRKHRLATTLIEFADLLAREPAPDELDALPPDFAKALELYRQVLGLEVSREFRDPVHFKVGTMQAKLGQHQEAADTFRSYLAEYDPAWSGAVGSDERRRGELREAPVAPGRHRFTARLELIRSQVALGQMLPARQNADDLVDLLSAENAAGVDDAARALLPEVRWQRHLTYRAEADPEVRINAARGFLAAHPGHANAPEVAREIAQTYEQAGRPDEAIAAYEAFIAGTGFTFDAASDHAARPDPGSGISPARQLEEWKQDAFFRIGRIRFDQKAYGEAIAQWESYVARHPNGSHWSAAQGGIVDAEFQMALDAVAAGDEAGARNRFEEFLRRHPLDDRSRQILFTLGQMHVTAGEAAEEADPPDPAAAADRFRKAIDDWARLVGKYPNTEESSLALYRTGVLQSEKLGRLDEAVASFKRLNWGSWAATAAARVAMLSERSLGVATERAFRTNEAPEIKVATRNIEKVTISLYPLNLEAYFRKTHELGRIDHLDIDLIEPTRTWDVALDGYAKFRALEQSVAIPFDDDRPGIFVVKVEGGEWTATTLVVRSDIDLVLKSSRREVLVYVEDRRAGRPAADADVLISDGSTIIGTGRTGEDGVFRGRFDGLKSGASVRVLALSEAGAASNLLSIESLRLSSGLTPRGYLYTDKPAYVPGGSVAIRAVARDVKDGNYIVPAQREWLLQVTDPNGRLFSRIEARLSDQGTFDSLVDLPAESPLGSYTVTALSKDRRLTFTSAFEVAQFQLDRVRLEFDFPREVYFRGEPIEGTITASYYWGSPASEQVLHYTLPDGRLVSGKTDAEGRLAFRFDPSGFQPGQPLVFQASLPTLNIASSDSVFLASVGFGIEVAPQQPVAIAGEPVEVKVRTTGADGSPVGQALTLTVLRRGEAPTNATLEAVPWINHAPAPAADQTVEEHRIQTDPETGEASITLAFEQGGRFTLRATGTDRFGQSVAGAGTLSVSDDEDSTKLRFFADKATYDVGAQVPIRLHSRVKSGLALLTFEGEEVLAHRVVPIHEGDNPVDLTVAHEHFPNFQVSVALMDGPVLRTATKELNVRRELRVAIKPARETFAPGETAEIEIATTDQLGRPVPAELSLAMVNEALFTAFGDRSGSIIDFFQQDARRFTDFSVGSTCGFSYTAQSMRREKVEEVVTVSSLVAAGNTVEQLQRILVDELRLNPQNSRLMLQCATNGGSLFNNDRPALFSESGVQLAEFQQVAQQAEMPDQVQARYANMAGMLAADGAQVANQSPSDDPFAGDAPRDTTTWAAQRQVAALHGGGALGLADSRRSDAAPTAEGVLLTAGVPAGGMPAPQSSAPRIDIDQAAVWKSPIVTDESGRAVVRVTLPESTAQWRISAKGCTADTLVGQGDASVITRREFFVELRTPEILQEGDAVPFLAVIHNLTDSADEATLTLTVEGAPEPFTSVRSAKLRPHGTAQVVFDAFPVPLSGAVRVRVAAAAGALGDDLARTIPVRPWGLEYASAAAGVTGTAAGATLSLPEGQRYHSRRLVVTVSPSIEQAIIDLALERPTPLAKLGAGAVTCLVRPDPQSPSSALVAAASALAYARDRRADAGEIAALAARVRTLVSALVVSQADDGSWAWNSIRGDSNLVSTATAYWGLVLANRAGVEVHPAALAAAEARLNAIFPQLEADNALGKSILLHALSLNGRADFSNANRLYRDRASLDETALAYLAATFVNMGRDGFARDLLALLDSRAATRNAGGREQVYWKSGRRAQLAGSPDETTAMILWCHARLNREAPAAARAAEFVLTEAVKPGSTRSLGAIVHALAAYHSDGERLDDDFTVTLVVNDQALRTIGSDELKSTLSFEIPESAILAGANAVRIDVAGRGRIRYAAALSGFSPDMVDPKAFETPYFVARHYYHDRLRYRDVPLDAASTSPVARLELGQKFRAVVAVNNHHAHQDYFVWEETLPSGALLVRDSVSGNFDRMEQREGRLLLYFKPGTVGSLSYELVAHAPGRYRVLPSVLRDAGDRGRMRIGSGAELEILAPDTESLDPYRMNRQERFELATKLFNDGRPAEALTHLDVLYNDPDVRRHYEQDLARMLLWIHTDRDPIDPARIVEVFEVLRERHPDLVIPFERILVVGRAYRELEEHERAWLVFRAAIQSSFLNDAGVSAVLEDQGQFLGSVAFQKQLWSEYPDGPDVATALFGLSQALFQRAPEADAIAAQERRLRRAPNRPAAVDAPENRDQDHPEKLAMLRESASLLRRFLTLYPTDPLADDAAFSQVNAFFALKDYPAVVDRAEAATARHPSSEFQTSFQYMAALGHFWQRHYEQALASAVAVAQGESRDRDYARYITAQIHHATGNPPAALDWYRQVSELYPDAADAIAYFEEKSVSLPEVTTFKPGEKVVVPLAYRNIREAVVQVYKVDLLKLYLRERNLSAITSIDLAGIDPESRATVPLGDGQDFSDRSRDIELPLTNEGAYLVICRGDDLFTSGLVLMTPLKLEIQEDAPAGSVRVNVRSLVESGYVPEVEVKVVGSAGSPIVSGETDLRGVFEAQGVAGTATVIAKAGDGQYAFHRGTVSLGQPPPTATTALPDPGAPQTEEELGRQQADGKAQMKGKQLEMSDYLENIDASNKMLQESNFRNWDTLRRGDNRGVEVKAAQ